MLYITDRANKTQESAAHKAFHFRYQISLISNGDIQYTLFYIM